MTKASTFERLRVVVADDDPIIRQLFSSRLEQMGCDTILAEDGGKAWKLLRSAKQVDLAIVDLDMPNVDGFSLIQCVRGHPRTRHMPVIVVTSRTDSKAIQDAFAAGATSFLTKPLTWTTFGSHIEYLMRLTQSAQQERSRAQRAEAAVRIKDLVLRRTLEQSAKGTSDILELVRLMADGIKEGADPATLLEATKAVANSAESIQSTLGRAQSMTRALCANVNASDARVPILNLIANAQTRIQRHARERGVPVCIARAPEHAYVSCAPESLSLALSHLLDNAIRFSKPGQSVSLEADVHQDGMLTIVVNDDGPGMDPDFYASLLNPISEEEVAEQNNSQGVGLPLVKAIAEAHGGVLEVRSMPNEGTTVMLVIPADRVHLEESDAA